MSQLRRIQSRHRPNREEMATVRVSDPTGSEVATDRVSDPGREEVDAVRASYLGYRR